MLTGMVCAHMEKALCRKGVKGHSSKHHIIHEHPCTTPHIPTRGIAHGHSPQTSCKLAAHTSSKNGYRHSGHNRHAVPLHQLTETHAATTKCCETRLQLLSSCAKAVPTRALLKATTRGKVAHTRVNSSQQRAPLHTRKEARPVHKPS